MLASCRPSLDKVFRPTVGRGCAEQTSATVSTARAPEWSVLATRNDHYSLGMSQSNVFAADIPLGGA